MQIGIDVRTAQLGAGRRGFGSYVYALVEGLARHAPEHEYVLVALPDRELPARLRALADGPQCRVVPLATPRLNWKGLAARHGILWRLYLRAHRRARCRDLERLARRERLDVLHLPVPLMVGLQFPIDARPAGAGCPVVRTLHDVNPLLLPAEYKPTFYGLRRLTYLEQLPWYGDADAVVAISRAAWEDAHPYLPGVDPARVHVIYNAVPDAFVPVTEPGRVDAVRARYGLEAPYLLVCSAGGGNKNFERVVEAFARTAAGAHGGVGPLDLVLAGMLPERFVERLRAHAAEHGLPPDRLRVLGFIPEADLVAVFAGARALVSVSLYEGFGLPAAQAMRVGVPVLAADTSAYPEVVGDAGLYVDPRAVDAIAAAMARLARDGALRAELAARGRARADRFTTAVQTRDLVALYTALAARPVAAPL